MHIDSIADHLERVDLIARWYYDEWGHLDPEGSLESWTKGLRERIPTTYVALEGETPLGSVTLTEHDMLTRPDLSPWLSGMYVIPERRGQGIGGALVRHAVNQAAGMGVERLYLYTHPARDFYRKLGWQDLEEDVYEGRRVTIMTIETGEGGVPDRPPFEEKTAAVPR